MRRWMWMLAPLTLLVACNDGDDKTCAEPCNRDACNFCDTSLDTPLCVNACSVTATCEAGQCVAPEQAQCDPVCGACQYCDLSGATPTCVDTCGAGMVCNAGVCQAPVCDPACVACQICDTSGAAPACVDLCSDGRACINGGCVRAGKHDTFAALNGPFDGAPDVTAECINCHPDEASDFLKSSHWLWEGNAPGMGDITIGKTRLINNFCISIISNEPRCTMCHAGYNWNFAGLDFSNPGNIDCLICHADPAAGYVKDLTTAGLPPSSVDLVTAAKSVGEPERGNCGFCHFKAGGGDNVKKGDLGSELTNPLPAADVHMGNGFTCADCHRGPGHTIRGQGVHLPVSEGRVSCEDCHVMPVHGNANLDNHALDIACQTCHVPAFSRQQPTKMNWDWSTAGNKTMGDNTGVVQETVGSRTVDVYNWKKGTFVWQQNVRPAYSWHNGNVERMTVDDTFPAGMGTEVDPVILGQPQAGIGDMDAKIFPFKRFTGRQPVLNDPRMVAVPKLFGGGGFWGSVPAPADYTPQAVEALWTSVLDTGARAAGQIGSGAPALTTADWDWAYTVMWMGINHEVAPADEALGCSDCHGNVEFDFEALGYTCADPMTGGCARP